MDDVRNDVAALLSDKIINTPSDNKIETKEPIEMYRVRKTWEDAKSQIGAYTDLNNAKEACDKAGKEYEVYNSKGVSIYPTEPVEQEPETTNPYKVGDEVSFINGAVYANGAKIPTWLYTYKLYVREIRKNDIIVVSTKKTGAITGTVKYDQVVPYEKREEIKSNPDFVPYIIRIDTDILNVRSGPGTNYRINTQVRKYELYTIVDEKNGFGKLKSGAGWIALEYTKRLK